MDENGENATKLKEETNRKFLFFFRKDSKKSQSLSTLVEYNPANTVYVEDIINVTLSPINLK